jgi:hypothetical protein
MGKRGTREIEKTRYLEEDGRGKVELLEEERFFKNERTMSSCRDFGVSYFLLALPFFPGEYGLRRRRMERIR